MARAALGTSLLFLPTAPPGAIALGDFDKDGNLDLVTVNSLNNDVSVLLGDGNGNFSSPTNFPAGDDPVSVVTGDFDEDGILDLAISAYGFGRW